MSSKTNDFLFILLYILQACILQFTYISVYVFQGVNDGQHFSNIAFFLLFQNQWPEEVQEKLVARQCECLLKYYWHGKFKDSFLRRSQYKE